jgi:hypothetical protein
MNRQKLNIVPKTASFTLDPNSVPSGTRFTNRGAVGAVTCTLPTLLNTAAPWVGYYVEFFGVADQNIAFAATTATYGVTFNNAAATSLTASTGGQKIGALLEADLGRHRNGTSPPSRGTGTLSPNTTTRPRPHFQRTRLWTRVTSFLKRPAVAAARPGRRARRPADHLADGSAGRQRHRSASASPSPRTTSSST